MNFLNDSFKTLKNVLEEKINFEEDEDEHENSANQREENERLKKLCQHQNEEVECNLNKHALAAKISMNHFNINLSKKFIIVTKKSCENHPDDIKKLSLPAINNRIFHFRSSYCGIRFSSINNRSWTTQERWVCQYEWHPIFY
jgi:hypothetical protein